MTENEIFEKMCNVKLLALDVDGVLTDGRIVYDSEGKESKFFDVKDGHGIVMVRNAGLEIALISGRSSDVTQKRAENLKIKHVMQGILDKEKTLREFTCKIGVSLEETLYIGDDVIDIGAMKIAGLSVAVADSHEEVLKAADMVTKRDGGRGAVREIADLLMKSRM